MLLHSFDIVFQEVPDEVSLALNISQCPHRCPGCHSQQLWGNEGVPLTYEGLDALMDDYRDNITCIAFMGGDIEPETLKVMADHIHQHGLKVAWYSGFPVSPKLLKEALPHFDYVKFGPYKAELGGLDSSTTNQRFYRRNNNEWQDITSHFKKKAH